MLSEPLFRRSYNHNMLIIRSIAFLFALLLFLCGGTQLSHAGDWPGLLGPERNGLAKGEKISPAFPAAGPKVLWKMKVGTGYSGPVVLGNKMIIFHRQDNQNIVSCRSSDAGKTLWTFSYPADYVDGFNFDDGPRSVPAMDASHVYTFGAEGMLHCLSLSDGKKIWAVDTRNKFKTDKSYFGRVSSPWIEGNKLLLNLGGENKHGIAAFEKSTGKILWGATDHPAGYSSPTVTTIGKRRHALCFTRTGLVSLNPDNGKVDFIEKWRSRIDASVNAACPIIHQDKVFISACYQTGGLLLQITPDGPKKIWSGDDILDSHYTTPVQHKGSLFGFHGRQERGAEFRCVDWTTGKVQWKHEPGGVGSVMVADDKLIILVESGKLILAPADPSGFKPMASAKILGRDIRAYPALSNGRFYARDKSQLVCVQLGQR